MKRTIRFRYSDNAKSSDLALPLGLLMAEGVVTQALSSVIMNLKPRLVDRIRQELEVIQERVGAFEAFFNQQGFRCPLSHQLQSTLKKGPPQINPFIDLLLMCEMSTGVLMGVQDFDRISGELIYDVLGSSETFEGMRGVISCRPREIVLRDETSIIASYFQGPDKRTSVTPDTSTLIFFVFSAPLVSSSVLDDCLLQIVEIIEPTCERVEFSVF